MAIFHFISHIDEIATVTQKKNEFAALLYPHFTAKNHQSRWWKMHQSKATGCTGCGFGQLLSFNLVSNHICGIIILINWNCVLFYIFIVQHYKFSVHKHRFFSIICLFHRVESSYNSLYWQFFLLFLFFRITQKVIDNCTIFLFVVHRNVPFFVFQNWFSPPPQPINNLSNYYRMQYICMKS